MFCKECEFYEEYTSVCILQGTVVNGDLIECDDAMNKKTVYIEKSDT